MVRAQPPSGLLAAAIDECHEQLVVLERKIADESAAEQCRWNSGGRDERAQRGPAVPPPRGRTLPIARRLAAIPALSSCFFPRRTVLWLLSNWKSIRQRVIISSWG